MSDIIVPTKRTIRFYAVGGTGIDLLRNYREVSNKDKSKVHATELDSYIDTSHSNMNGISSENVYRIPGIPDGGGKDREIVKEATYPALPEIMLNHPAGDMNVVLFSTAGGTGSGAGPLILGTLLKEGKSAVAVVIADHTSDKSTSNGIAAMTDMESISHDLDKEIVIHYSKNDPTKSTLDNDDLSKFVMGAISVLSSGQNDKLDRQDVHNFINFPEITHHDAGLGQLHVMTRSEALNDLGHIASFAAVLKSETSIVPGVEMDYDAVGYMPVDVDSYDTDFFFAIIPTMDDVVADLLECREKIIMKQRVKPKAKSLLGGDTGFNKNSGVKL